MWKEELGGLFVYFGGEEVFRRFRGRCEKGVLGIGCVLVEKGGNIDVGMLK